MTNTYKKTLGLLSLLCLTTLLFTACTNVSDTQVPTTIAVTEDVIQTSLPPTSQPLETIATDNYGAKGADSDPELTLEDMMRYAIEDEYLAHAEYSLILSEMDVTRPFSNIIKAETTHIAYMEDLYESFGFDLPTVDPSQHISLPDSLNEAYKTGVTAEIDNIAMYDLFLAQTLPDEVRLVFEKLKAGSESHLKAFEKNVR